MRIGVSLLSASFLTWVVGGHPPQQVFRSETTVVRLDVSVLDKNRRPVKGLTAADFSVLEDGSHRKIVAFSAVDVPELQPTAAPWQLEVSPDVHTNIVGDRRLLVLVFDTSTEGSTFEAKTARSVGHSLVDALGPADVMAVVFTMDNRGAQDFTADRALLRAAIDRVGIWGNEPRPDPAFDPLPGDVSSAPSPVAPATGANFTNCFGVNSVRTLGRVAEALRSVPDRRKAIVYVSAGVPLNPEALAPGGRDPSGCNAAVMLALGDTFRQIQQANANVYPVSVRGLSIRPPDGGPDRMTDFLLMIAANSGGKATINNNKPDRTAVTRILTENGSYYLLGYEPGTEARPDRPWRRIEVKVNRRDVEVRARSKFYDSRGTPAEPLPPLVGSISGLLPARDLPMRVSALSVPSSDLTKPVVAVAIGLETAASSARHTEQFDILTSAFTPEGREVRSERRTATVTLREGGAGTARFELLTEIALDRGRYQLRIGVHHPRTGRSGSTYVPIEVPAFSHEKLSVSSPIVSATPSWPSATAGALSSALPAAPTVRRVFLRSDRVHATVRIGQGGSTELQTVTLTATIVDLNTKTVSQSSFSIEAEGFGASRTADATVEVPVAQLPRGAYLLAINALRGTDKVTRNVRFDVE